MATICNMSETGLCHIVLKCHDFIYFFIVVGSIFQNQLKLNYKLINNEKHS